MKYVSTRGKSPALNFEEAMLTGLAPDGGLYVPDNIPTFTEQEIAQMAGMSYQDLAFKIMKPFVAGDIPDKDLEALIADSYADFRHGAIAPLTQLENNLWILELFHGPTLAFKDFALQFLGRVLDYLLKKRNQRVVIMGATSGDTGSAAIEGCRHSDNVDIFILHPHNRVSDVQRRQMTTVISDNVFNIAVEGNFDDCQNMVKASFSDQSFLPEDRQLVAVNSINWARIMAQIVYYFYAGVALGSPKKPMSFSVPTGNFGDIFAGYLAKRMGLPIEQLVIATNANDILHRCISGNDYSLQPLIQSLSPSMDIMISSNFERMMFDLHDRDGEVISGLMADLKENGSLQMSEKALASAKALFSSHRSNDDEMTSTIAAEYAATEYLLDPHTAIGVEAARQTRWSSTNPMICLATAHPAKFPDAVQKSGYPNHPPLPHHLKDLFERDEEYAVIANEARTVQQHMVSQVRA